MQFVRLFDLVDNIDELSTTHEPDENHHEEEHVDVFAEEDARVEHVEGEKDRLRDGDRPDAFDLDK